MEQDLMNEKAKKLKHVKVYNRLYSMIQDGTLSPGSQLPSEPELAQQMGVSRMTLRRALALLQEDNLVTNVRGKGNFINDFNTSRILPGMEISQHPIYGAFSGEISETELEFRIEPPSDPILLSLECKTAVVVIADRWYKQAQKASAYSLSFIPIEVISEKQIDLRNEQDLLQFLECDIYKETGCHSTCYFSCTNTGNFTAAKYTLSQQDSFILIQETVYSENHRVLVSSKHYLPTDQFKMKLNAQSGLSTT